MERFGPFDLHATLGFDDLGEILRGVDRRDGARQVFVRRLGPGTGEQHAVVERLRHDAVLVGRLDRSHILGARDGDDVGVADDRIFLAADAADAADGVALGALLHEGGALPAARAVEIVGQVAVALDAAHRQGLLHRDVSPSTVLIDTQHSSHVVHLADLGVRAALHSLPPTTGTVPAAPAYPAPEWMSSAADPRLDVYALGCLLYEMLTGHAPFSGSPAQVLWAHTEAPPPRPSSLVPGLPHQLDGVVTAAMAKAPADRPPSAIAMAQAAFDSSRTAAAPAPGSDDRRGRSPVRWRRPLTLAVSVGVLVLAAVLVPVLATTRSNEPPARPSIPVNRVAAVLDIPGPSTELALSPDGRRAYIGTAPYVDLTTSRYSVLVLDTATNAVAATIPVPAVTQTLAVSVDGRRLYVVNGDSGSASVIDTATNITIATFAVDPSARRVVMDRDGRRAYIANHEGRSVSVLDLTTNTITRTIPLPGQAFDLNLGPGGQLYVVNAENSISVIDTAHESLTVTVPVPSPRALALTPDGRHAYVLELDKDQIWRFDTSTWRSDSVIAVGSGPITAVASPTAPYVYVTNIFGDSVSVIDTTTNTVTAAIPCDGASFMALTPDGRRGYVTAGRSEKSVTVMDLLQ